jgi:uncharacterized protein (DUF1697 family)
MLSPTARRLANVSGVETRALRPTTPDGCLGDRQPVLVHDTSIENVNRFRSSPQAGADLTDQSLDRLRVSPPAESRCLGCRRVPAGAGRPVTGVIEWVVTRYVAFLRAVNVGRRRVAMATAREILSLLGLGEVSSYVNSGNLMFSATGKAADHEAVIRSAMENKLGFELTTFVRTAAQVSTLVGQRPFGALASGHTHFALLPLTKLTAREKRAVEAMSNDRDEVLVRGRDVHWLIRAKSTETTLGPKQWLDALPGNPTTARNMTMLTKLAERL